jgi:hypothetical protein
VNLDEKDALALAVSAINRVIRIREMNRLSERILTASELRKPRSLLQGFQYTIVHFRITGN